MKSPADQLVQIVKETIFDGYDLIRRCCHVKEVYTDRDVEYIQRRYDAEGIKFLTTDLPKLGDWFDEVFLKEEELEPPVGFKPYGVLSPHCEKPSQVVPLFLLPFWRYLTDKRYTDTPDYFKLVRIVRTTLLSLKKLEVPFEDTQVAEKLETFLSIEQELNSYSVDWNDPRLRSSQELLDHLFLSWDASQFRSKHGPGAVAGREKGADKWNFSTYWHSVNLVFPAYDLWPLKTTIYRHGTKPDTGRRLQLAAFANAYRSLKWEDEPTARLLFVPKDSRGPRIISCEPKELMYLQQGVSEAMMNLLEHHSLTKGHVNFADQSINGRLALEASASREWATIDLSDASDRVSVQLVEYLFPKKISRQLLALRSTSTQLPDGTCVPLKKYAPMGSALCFPVESTVFWSLCVGAIVTDGVSLSEALDSVYVYGDDLIIRSEYATRCIELLEECCLKVNISKSLVGTHYFRESCGVDAFKGHLVTPSRIRKFPPRGPEDGTSLVAFVKYAENSLYSPRRSTACLKVAEKVIGSIPRTPVPQGFLSLVDPNNYWKLSDYEEALAHRHLNKSVTWNESMSYYQTILLQLRVKTSKQEIDAWLGLQRSLVEKGARDAVQVVTNPVTLIRKRKCFITYIPMGG